ncbi:uncharacterized protein LOC112685660 [Sipha flava]|uniref:Uncharacterized protein LOC112685660 n=1 Tax=Sipha flava TaxID=143950 RepID=A0A8B8FRK1_9HEMI|nr:uncharacterized protein LOC112685660 [Sipha flava]
MNYYIYILCVAFSSSAFSIDLKILPNVPELTVTSESNYVIKCQGNEPVKWIIPESNPFFNADRNSSIKILQSEANTKNVSLLMLNRVSYLNIGYYYCVPLSGDRKSDSINSENIYLFVRKRTMLY